MHVKYVILDGFKSYGNRVSVGEFDKHFNAITGLNGSGKSNILDGIVFVLGLSSLNTVRAQSLSDLIYKGGNVKRASVSIVFDNSDKRRNKCPLGYEKYDEIVVSRTVEEASNCKYYLNSLLSTKRAVQDMFESVQLNINNPNFMIMQGKITKVVNMKPKEILCMIEECIGAANYQNKRNKSIADVVEKDRLVAEIQKTLTTVVYPSMRRQLQAFEMYQEFKEVERKRHKLAQNYAVVAYGHYEEVIRQKGQQVSGFKDADDDEEKKILEYKQQIEDKQKRKAEIKKESHKIATEKVANVEKQLKEERKKLVTQEVALETASAAVKDGEHNLKKSQKALANEEKQVADFRTKSGNLIAEFTGITREIEDAKANLTATKQKEADLNSGKVIDDEGNTVDLEQRLVVVEDEIGKIRPKRDHEGRLLQNESKKLRELETKLSKTPSDHQIEKDFRTAEQELTKLRQQIQRLNISVEQYASSDKDYNAASQSLNNLDAQRRDILREYPYLAFDYSPPYPNFNPSSVHGAVFELFEAPDLGNYKNAFEVAVQGVLNVIVVDTDATCRAIIKNGNVAQRRTYMPLSKVRKLDRSPPTQAELNRRVGGAGKAICAFDLIQCDRQYVDLMKTYLGRTVLCDTMDTAKQVAYNMGYKAITVQGDVCDPDGGMQGGTRKNIGRYITACLKLRPINIERNKLLMELRDLKARIQLYNNNAPLLKKYEQASSHLKNTAELRQCTEYAALFAEVNALKEAINTRNAKMEEWDQELTRLTKEQATLRKTMDSREEVKTKGLKAVKAEMTKWTKFLEAAQKKYDAKKAAFETLEGDLKAKEAMLQDYQKDIEKAEKELADARKSEEETQKLLDEARIAFEEKNKEHEDAAEEYRVWDEESGKLEAEINSIQKKIQKLELAKINRDNELKNTEELLESAKNSVEALIKKHPELKLRTHYDQLEKPNQSLKKCQNELENAEKRYEELRQRIDPDASEKLEETKEMERSSKAKLELLTKNKCDIESAIKVLDDQKATLVHGAFSAVNKEFGDMMSTLLPESTAKLVPVSDEQHLDDGLNIHVRLGGVWKESLTELSGGQRSLVALALVLSLCMYQPAPFYVLDEIDAALDLSHTQNIGALIKNRFQDTQFICVSLKDGMYTNANVLFTTQFQDQKSSIIRTSKTGGDSGGNASKYANEGKRQLKGHRTNKRM